jgi:peptidoglycan/LPS O-acetylase OafA/YrhL
MSPLRIGLPAPVRGRIAALDELKGVAIILVILYHAGGVLGLRDVLHGEVGVDFFVILSGVGLTLSARREGAGRFLLRRFWRIYPAYWIALTVFLVADACFRNTTFGTTDIALHYLGIHGWFGDVYAMGINDSFWFVTLILTLYVLYLPLRRILGRADRLLLAGAVVSVVPILAYFYAGQAAIFAHMALRIPGFFLGLLIGTLLRDGRLEIPLSAKTAAAFLILFYVTYALGIIVASFLIGFVGMLAYAAIVRPALNERARRDLRFLGDRSLEIFLIHQPLIREYNVLVLDWLFPGSGKSPMALTLGMCVGLAVTLALASGLHVLLARIRLPGADPAPLPAT